MATFPGQIFNVFTSYQDSKIFRLQAELFPLETRPCKTIKIFKMIAKDIDYIGSGPKYRTWSVINTPDIDGSRYYGEKSGNSPLADIAVEAEIIFEE